MQRLQEFIVGIQAKAERIWNEPNDMKIMRAMLASLTEEVLTQNAEIQRLREQQAHLLAKAKIKWVAAV